MEKQNKTPTLYDLTADMQAALDDLEMWAEDHDGDVTDYPFDRLEKLEGDIKDKVLKCAVMYKEWKAMGDVIRDEEKSLAKRRKAWDNRGDGIKRYMESCLPPNAKFENGRASVTWRKNPPAVEVLVNAQELPALFIKHPEPEADKTALKAKMVEYEIDLLDGLGSPIFDADNKPLKRFELQVRWPVPVEDQDRIGKKEIVLAREKQGRSLLIK